MGADSCTQLTYFGSGRCEIVFEEVYQYEVKTRSRQMMSAAPSNATGSARDDRRPLTHVFAFTGCRAPPAWGLGPGLVVSVCINPTLTTFKLRYSHTHKE